MPDTDQKIVDKAIMRDANVTATEFRQRLLNDVGREFVQRVDARAAEIQVSTPKRPIEIQVRETHLDGGVVTLPFPAVNDPPKGDTGTNSLGTIDEIIIVFNGTAYYNTLNGVIGSPV